MSIVDIAVELPNGSAAPDPDLLFDLATLKSDFAIINDDMIILKSQTAQLKWMVRVTNALLLPIFLKIVVLG